MATGAEAPAQVRALPEFPNIHRHYFDFVWNGARSLGVGTDIIDAVVQEVFIVIHARLHTLREPSALHSWIYGIVRRTAFAHLRVQRNRHTSVVDFTDDSSSTASLSTPSDALALMALDEHQRRFPSGALVQERAAARIQALCALGRTEEASAESLNLKRMSPNSPQAAHSAKPCESLHERH